MLLNCFNLGSSKHMAPFHHACFCTPTHISCVCSLTCANTELQSDTLYVTVSLKVSVAFCMLQGQTFAVCVCHYLDGILLNIVIPKSVAPVAVCNKNVMCSTQFMSTIVTLERASLMIVPWLWRKVSGLSPSRPEFYVGPVCVGFVLDRVAVG